MPGFIGGLLALREKCANPYAILFDVLRVLGSEIHTESCFISLL